MARRYHHPAHFGWLIFILLIPFWVFGEERLSNAEVATLAQYKGKVNLAYEIEMPHTRLKNLINFFDLSKTENKLRRQGRWDDRFSNEEADSYLDNIDNLNSLPVPLRKKLVAGLSLTPPKLAEKSISAPNNNPKSKMVILGPDGKPFQSALIMPEGIKSIETEPGSEMANLTQMQWDYDVAILRQRWRALDLKVKSNAMHANSLPLPLKLALYSDDTDLSKSITTEGKNDTKIHSLPSTPQPLKSLFAKLGRGLTNDSRVIEFAHRKYTKDPVSYLEDLRLFTLVGLLSKDFNDLTAPPDSAGYHLNISVPGRDFTKGVASALNRRLLLQFLAAGVTDIFSDHYGFVDDINTRGLIRLKENDYMEIRAHVLDPEKELKEYVELLTQPEEVALAKLNRDIQNLLNPATMAEIAKYDPKLLASIIEDSAKGLQPAEIKITPTSQEFSTALNVYFDLLKHGKIDTQIAASQMTKLDSQYPKLAIRQRWEQSMKEHYSWETTNPRINEDKFDEFILEIASDLTLTAALNSFHLVKDLSKGNEDILNFYEPKDIHTYDTSAPRILRETLRYLFLKSSNPEKLFDFYLNLITQRPRSRLRQLNLEIQNTANQEILNRIGSRDPSLLATLLNSSVKMLSQKQIKFGKNSNLVETSWNHYCDEFIKGSVGYETILRVKGRMQEFVPVPRQAWDRALKLKFSVDQITGPSIKAPERVSVMLVQMQTDPESSKTFEEILNHPQFLEYWGKYLENFTPPQTKEEREYWFAVSNFLRNLFSRHTRNLDLAKFKNGLAIGLLERANPVAFVDLISDADFRWDILSMLPTEISRVMKHAAELFPNLPPKDQKKLRNWANFTRKTMSFSSLQELEKAAGFSINTQFRVPRMSKAKKNCPETLSILE